MLALMAVCSAPAPAEVANRIIVRVNDRMATLYDFEDRYQEALARIEQMPTDAGDREELLQQRARDVMKVLFEELLVLSRADQMGIFVSDVEIDEAVQNMRESNDLTDEDLFQSALAQAGLSLDLLRKQFAQQITFQRVMGREVYAQVDVQEEDLRRYYRENEDEFRDPEKVYLREVVVLDERGDSASAAEMAAALLADLRSGKTLDEVRQGLADTEVSSVIDLGWVASGDLDATLEDAVWGLESGQYSEPIRARGGLHIAQLVERQESVVRAFKEVEDEIRLDRQRERTNEKLEEYLVELEQKAYLYLNPPAAAAGFRTATGETPLNAEFPVLANPAEQQ
jgi:peptidyl-prolyl cis-trans isomerase SurA